MRCCATLSAINCISHHDKFIHFMCGRFFLITLACRCSKFGCNGITRPKRVIRGHTVQLEWLGEKGSEQGAGALEFGRVPPWDFESKRNEIEWPFRVTLLLPCGQPQHFLQGHCMGEEQVMCAVCKNRAFPNLNHLETYHRPPYLLTDSELHDARTDQHSKQERNPQ